MGRLLSSQTGDGVGVGEHILIDSPVGPFSPEEDILAWIKELKTYPDRPEVRKAIADANEFLKRSRD